MLVIAHIRAGEGDPEEIAARARDAMVSPGAWEPWTLRKLEARWQARRLL